MYLFTSTGRSEVHSNKTATYSLYLIYLFSSQNGQTLKSQEQGKKKQTIYIITPAEGAPNLRAKLRKRHRNATGNLSNSTAVSLHSIHS